MPLCKSCEWSRVSSWNPASDLFLIFPLQPMGSERMEMRKRQTSVAQETSSSIQTQPGVGNRGSNACCFCWCCCCSCSWYAFFNHIQTSRGKKMTASHHGSKNICPLGNQMTGAWGRGSFKVWLPRWKRTTQYCLNTIKSTGCVPVTSSLCPLQSTQHRTADS